MQHEEQQKPPPTIMDDIPPLSTLTNKPPSPLLTFNLIDILYLQPLFPALHVCPVLKRALLFPDSRTPT